jgi:hypothetical protein
MLDHSSFHVIGGTHIANYVGDESQAKCDYNGGGRDDAQNWKT